MGERVPEVVVHPTATVRSEDVRRFTAGLVVASATWFTSMTNPVTLITTESRTVLGVFGRFPISRQICFFHGSELVVLQEGDIVDTDRGRMLVTECTFREHWAERDGDIFRFELLPDYDLRGFEPGEVDQIPMDVGQVRPVITVAKRPQIVVVSQPHRYDAPVGTVGRLSSSVVGSYGLLRDALRTFPRCARSVVTSTRFDYKNVRPGSYEVLA